MTSKHDPKPSPKRRPLYQHAAPTAAERRERGGVATTAPNRTVLSGFLGVIGELLITAAIVIGLYVVWQLWWTTFMVQGGVNDQIEAFQNQNPTPVVQTPPEHRTDDPPSVGDVSVPEVYGVLHVPKWNWMQIPIAEGTLQHEILDLGYAGHYVETQQAGELGNFALAGHRRTYGNNFRRVDILKPGDPIIVETKNAYLVYEMQSFEIVQPTQTSVLLPVPNHPNEVPTKRIMTMTTCNPEYGNTERYIVYSEMKYWTAKDQGKPELLWDEPTRH